MTDTATRRAPVRLGSRPFLAALAVGDALVVAGFIAYGLTNHAIDPLEYPVHTLRTAVPFVVGWFLVAPVVGAFRGRTLASYPLTVAVTLAAWVLAAILGASIRATAWFPGGAHPVFVLVIAGFGLGFVLPWRLLATAVRRRLAPRGERP